jgi:hypothetical protein
MEQAAETSRHLDFLAGRIVLLAAELDRREGWRAWGATSVVAWLSERCNVSTATARAWSHVGTRLLALPKLAEGLCVGALSFDQVRAVADAATPASEHAYVAQASGCSASSVSWQGPIPPLRFRLHPNGRMLPTLIGSRSVRFNDSARTVIASLLEASHAEVRAGLEATARTISSDGDTRWDQRLADALVSLVRAGGRRGRRPVKSGRGGPRVSRTDARPLPRRGSRAAFHPHRL